jgi:poly(3-hydroxybutyrate) depolymerase
MRRIWSLPLLALAALPAHADVVDLPAGTDPVPLVVVLHGDREHAISAAARWRRAIDERGWAMLALDCPGELGCKDSWWGWNGEPTYVLDQVAAIARRRAIDPTRIYLVGWSGGATYIGQRAPAWGRVFAAVVIHGGGQPPPGDECPAQAMPAYFLVGDKNPLHRLSKDLRAYFEGCNQEVAWDLVRGADHAKEEAALTFRKAGEILDWLAARHR